MAETIRSLLDQETERYGKGTTTDAIAEVAVCYLRHGEFRLPQNRDKDGDAAYIEQIVEDNRVDEMREKVRSAVKSGVDCYWGALEDRLS